MRIVFAGNPQPAVETLATLHREHEIIAVITSPEKPQGRGHKAHKSAVAKYAIENSLPLIETQNINADEQIKKLQFDLGVVVAFGQLIGTELLDCNPWLNVHYSLLPRWRGASPVQHSLLYGDDVTGVTTFFLERDLDSGPIIAQATYVPREDETGSSLMDVLSEVGATLASKSLRIIEEGIVEPRAQVGETTYAPKITNDDLRINWSKSAIEIERKTRAFYEKPGAFTTFRSKRIQIGPTAFESPENSHVPGTIFEVNKKIFVATGSTPVQLNMVKPEGKNWMDAASWVRGIHNRESMVFE